MVVTRGIAVVIRGIIASIAGVGGSRGYGHSYKKQVVRNKKPRLLTAAAFLIILNLSRLAVKSLTPT